MGRSLEKRIRAKRQRQQSADKMAEKAMERVEVLQRQIGKMQRRARNRELFRLGAAVERVVSLEDVEKILCAVRSFDADAPRKNLSIKINLRPKIVLAKLDDEQRAARNRAIFRVGGEIFSRPVLLDAKIFPFLLLHIARECGGSGATSGNSAL